MVFDLLEERNHVLKIGNSFITESDAFKECGVHLENAEIVECGSEEWFGLWRALCVKNHKTGGRIYGFMVKFQQELK